MSTTIPQGVSKPHECAMCTEVNNIYVRQPSRLTFDENLNLKVSFDMNVSNRPSRHETNPRI